MYATGVLLFKAFDSVAYASSLRTSSRSLKNDKPETSLIPDLHQSSTRLT